MFHIWHDAAAAYIYSRFIFDMMQQQPIFTHVSYLIWRSSSLYLLTFHIWFDAAAAYIDSRFIFDMTQQQPILTHVSYLIWRSSSLYLLTFHIWYNTAAAYIYSRFVFDMMQQQPIFTHVWRSSSLYLLTFHIYCPVDLWLEAANWLSDLNSITLWKISFPFHCKIYITCTLYKHLYFATD